MDRFVNKKIEKQTIYEIYRACRLCGAGGGYKMPIIQNVVNLDNCDVELKQKIRECVQIEVHQNDKMPPLICELCVDKVNDFYEFLEMCRQTNKRTRLKLGLPPQMLPRGAPDAGDCILGVTEPIFVNDEDSNEPLSDKRTKAGGKVKKGEKWKDAKVKVEKPPPRASRRPRSPSPPRLRGARRSDDNVTLSRLQIKSHKSVSPPPKSILKKGKKPEPSHQSPGTRLKRSREQDAKTDTPPKRVKICLQPVPARPKLSPRQQSREEARQRQRRREAEAEEARRARDQQLACGVCGGVFKTPQALVSHRRTHVVTYTNTKLACNACAAWFVSEAEASTHHGRHSAHRPYRCRRCSHSYTTLRAYDEHIEKGRCVQGGEVPDVRCEGCWRTFPTRPLMDKHRCPGEGARPGKCTKCGKNYATKKSLASHTRYCRKGEVVIPSELRRRLRPLQVRVARCDPLLWPGAEHHDVAGVPANYGLDSRCVYPYLTTGVRIKTEPSDCMVKINDMDFGSYVHWDSEDSGDSDELDHLDSFDLGFTRRRKVSSLTACALKTIFSNKLLGKVPRKYRRLKIESVIESALNDSLSDLNLNDNDAVNDKVSDKGVKFDDEDDLFPKTSNETVTNNDFDSLFNDSKTDVGDGDKLDKDNDEGDESKNVNDSGAKDSEGNENNDSAKELTSNVDNSGAESTFVNEENSVTEKSFGSTDFQSENQSQDTNDAEEELLKTDLNGDDKEITQDDKEIIEDGNRNTEDDEKEIAEDGNRITEDDEKEIAEDDNRITEDDEKEIAEDGNRITEDDEKESIEDVETKVNQSPIENHNDSGHGVDLDEGKESSQSDIDRSESDTREEMELKLEKDYPKDKDENVDKVKDYKSQVNGGDDVDDINMNEEDMSGTEYDDCELMAEIDAQIGEKKRQSEQTDEERRREKLVNEKERVENKHVLDLSQDQSMDLDSISDGEFDIDD